MFLLLKKQQQYRIHQMTLTIAIMVSQDINAIMNIAHEATAQLEI